MTCILCHGKNTTITQSVKRADLIAIYKRALKVNVENLIKSDLCYYLCNDCDLRFFVCEDGTIPTGDNDFYNTLNTTLSWYYTPDKEEYHYAKDFITPDSKVLEVGCGKAAFAQFLPPSARKQYVGLEFSTNAKAMAEQNGIYIENIAIEDYAASHAKSFDIACSFQVLEHVSNPYSFLKSQVDCLKDSQLNGGGGI